MKIKQIILSLILVVISLSIYWQTSTHGFYLYDDGDYVVNNSLILKGITPEGIKWAFSSFHSGNWHPLTWLSHMLDVQLFGVKASGHHLVNLLLHVVNALLVFFLLMRLTSELWRGFAVALLFAIHPLHVESVAWIAERKDLLSGLFFLLTLLAWERYARKQSIISYLCSLLLFALGLMSKPMLVTLPFILLLLDWWPLGRFDAQFRPARLFAEKIPFFMLSLASSIVTFLAQNQAGAVVSFIRSPLPLRLANAVVSYGLYIKKMMWPNDLAVFYPSPTAISWWQPAAWGMVLIGVSIVLLKVRKRYPYLVVGWLWYLGMLVPVIGVIQVGAQAMADRYTYLPLLGLFIMISWGTGEAATRVARKTAIAACAVVVIGLLTFCAWQQAGLWKSNILLFSRALEKAPVTSLALTNLAKAYIAEGTELKERWDLDGALKLFNLAAVRSTGSVAATAHSNIGLILAMQGKNAEAERAYATSLQYDTTYTEAYYNMGLLHLGEGRLHEAATCFREVVRLDPENKTARRYLQENLR
jgi:protein O-mannosyl-transferase